MPFVGDSACRCSPQTKSWPAGYRTAKLYCHAAAETRSWTVDWHHFSWNLSSPMASPSDSLSPRAAAQTEGDTVVRRAPVRQLQVAS
mmetsp:Transcript_52895/g.92911  ORF Transcript_52895/g.92911 Transcript_52895/m.92911 type:complete len:87 (+) Transcript_52895:494-754(+)